MSLSTIRPIRAPGNQNIPSLTTVTRSWFSDLAGPNHDHSQDPSSPVRGRPHQQRRQDRTPPSNPSSPKLGGSPTCSQPLFEIGHDSYWYKWKQSTIPESHMQSSKLKSPVSKISQLNYLTHFEMKAAIGWEQEEMAMELVTSPRNSTLILIEDIIIHRGVWIEGLPIPHCCPHYQVLKNYSECTELSWTAEVWTKVMTCANWFRMVSAWSRRWCPSLLQHAEWWGDGVECTSEYACQHRWCSSVCHGVQILHESLLTITGEETWPSNNIWWCSGFQ